MELLKKQFSLNHGEELGAWKGFCIFHKTYRTVGEKEQRLFSCLVSVKRLRGQTLKALRDEDLTLETSPHGTDTPTAYGMSARWLSVPSGFGHRGMEGGRVWTEISVSVLLQMPICCSDFTPLFPIEPSLEPSPRYVYV